MVADVGRDLDHRSAGVVGQGQTELEDSLDRALRRARWDYAEELRRRHLGSSSAFADHIPLDMQVQHACTQLCIDTSASIDVEEDTDVERPQVPMSFVAESLSRLASQRVTLAIAPLAFWMWSKWHNLEILERQPYYR